MPTNLETVKPLPSDQDASGRSFGDLEMQYLSEVIESGRLFGPKGRFVKEFESSFAVGVGVARGLACSSGSAAIHAAVAALDFEPGAEIITTPITDMGALSPILLQGAIPVFADVDSSTGNVTAATIEDRITDRTAAIVVTHLFGVPCDMDPVLELAGKHGLPVIEDAAQAFGAEYRSQPVGSMGVIGCFSLQQGKHITCGEGGVLVTDDEALAIRAKQFVNKAWDYDAPSDHDFLAPNYRMSELQGAVALAQLSRLADGVGVRRELAKRLAQALTGVAGIEVPSAPEGAAISPWRFPILVDASLGGPGALAAGLRELGVPSSPRYIQKPAFRCGIFVNQRTFGDSGYPFTLAQPSAVDYDASRFPGAFSYLERVLVLPWNERFTEDDTDRIAEAIVTTAEELST